MQRNTFLALIAQWLKSAPVVALLGPRQCGKTTLARQFAEFRQEVHFFDLEDPTDLAVLENPKLALQDLSGLVVLDEIQRLPDLFPVLRVLVDRPEAASRFLILWQRLAGPDPAVLRNAGGAHQLSGTHAVPAWRSRGHGLGVPLGARRVSPLVLGGRCRDQSAVA